MSKFNTSTSTMSEVLNHPDVTTNHEGGVAFNIVDAREKLYTMVASSFMNEDLFYVDGKTHDNEIKSLILQVAKEDPKFILQLAQYCRKELYLRSVPVCLLGYAAREITTKQFVREYTPKIINRPDEITEVLQFYKSYFIPKVNAKHTFPASLKKGVAASFKKFDEYSLAKYNTSKTMKLRDALRIVVGHLNEKNEERRGLYQKILDNKLALSTEDTWEAKISTGSTKENWEEILHSGKMGVFAVTRNLRNLLENQVDMTPAIVMLSSPKMIASSKMYPFRFYTAYKAVNQITITHPQKQQVLDALRTAIDLSVENLPKMAGKTFISVDLSGSMSSSVSNMSDFTRRELGGLMGSLATKFSDEYIVSAFGDRFALADVSKKDSTITNTEKLLRTRVGQSTNGHLTIKYLLDNNIKVDRIMLFTDEEMYNKASLYGDRDAKPISALLKDYKRTVNPNVHTYVFNLAGSGKTVFPRDEKNVVLIGGFSDKIFQFVNLYEKDKESIINYIKNTY